MGWVRLEDDFYDNGKFALAGPLGMALWVTMLAWSNRNLTDGFIPTAKARTLIDWTGVHWRAWDGDLVGGCEDPEPVDVADHLVVVGLLEPREGGYQIHDYHDYQPKAEKVREAKAENAQRMREWREAQKRKRGRNEDGDAA